MYAQQHSLFHVIHKRMGKNMEKKKIGIVGGMGPLATAELFRMLIKNTKSENDSGHIRIFIDNNPQVPDRTNAIMNNGVSPAPEIIRSILGLEQLGADMILIPCNASHTFYDEINENSHVEVINMVEETVSALKKEGISKVGVLATTGTICGGVYKKYLDRYGIDAVYPTAAEQLEVMNFIYSGVKSGKEKYDAAEFQRIIDRLYREGAQELILGCTELLLGIEMYGVTVGKYIEPMRVLADTAIIKAGYELRSE